ncbi:MAG: DoxX family protein [Planctomycetota bacterium]|nr:MAG: DoxX family protein [Planctomycetota bacterium]
MDSQKERSRRDDISSSEAQVQDDREVQEGGGRVAAGDLVLLILRVILGVVFFAHGAQKLFGWFGGKGLEAMAGFLEAKLGMAPGMMWAVLAGGGEFFGAILVFIGLLTRFAALVLCIVMGVAIAKVHFPAFFLSHGGMEYALTLLLVALALCVGGGGRISLDFYFCGKGKK